MVTADFRWLQDRFSSLGSCQSSYRLWGEQKQAEVEKERERERERERENRMRDETNGVICVHIDREDRMRERYIEQEERGVERTEWGRSRDRELGEK